MNASNSKRLSLLPLPSNREVLDAVPLVDLTLKDLESITRTNWNDIKGESMVVEVMEEAFNNPFAENIFLYSLQRQAFEEFFFRRLGKTSTKSTGYYIGLCLFGCKSYRR